MAITDWNLANLAKLIAGEEHPERTLLHVLDANGNAVPARWSWHPLNEQGTEDCLVFVPIASDAE